LSLRRRSADALDFKANLLYQSWWLSPDGQYLQDSQLLKEALIFHREAYALRKNWAFSATRQALIYSQQATLNKDFDRWFVEAHRLGLYETSLARSLMVIGVQNWERLTEPQHILVLDFIRTSIEQKSNSPELIALFLQQYNLYNHVCSALPSTIRRDRVCETDALNST